MNELNERIKDLGVEYLIAQARSHNGDVNRAKQAAALVNMLRVDHIENLFDFIDASYWFEKEHKDKLAKLIANRNNSIIDSSNNQKQDLFEQIVYVLLEKTEEEAQAKKTAREAWKLREKINDLEAEIEFGKPAQNVTAWDRLNSRVNLPYFVILCLVFTLIGGLVLLGMTATLTVNVDFSIGEIIGGLLVGTGVAAAGISYATKSKTEHGHENE